MSPAARVTSCSIAAEDGANHDMTRYVGDKRDPVVIDNVLHTMQFSALGEAGAGEYGALDALRAPSGRTRPAALAVRRGVRGLAEGRL